MPITAIIDSIKDKLGNIIYPKTVTKAVYDDVSGDRLDNIISEHDSNINNILTNIDTQIILVSTSRTLTLTDKTKVLKCLSASDITVTIPNSTSVDFPINSEIVLIRYGFGNVFINKENGVTIYSSDNKTSINKQYEAVTLKKIATNEWLLIGSLN